MMLCVPNCITLSASEFRRTVYTELIKELTREKQLLDQVAATAAATHTGTRRCFFSLGGV